MVKKLSNDIIDTKEVQGKEIKAKDPISLSLKETILLKQLSLPQPT
jgi:hypothetical protein